MFMKELQWVLEKKEQMDILFIHLVSEMGNPCISVLRMGKCATQITLELRKERSEAPQAIKSSRNMHKIPQDVQMDQKLKSIAKATVAR
jgi:hypothetical protein